MPNPRSDCTSEDVPAPDHWSVAATAAFYERERLQEATMTPEERARRFVAKQSRGEWGEELETEDAALLAAAIRDAENDVLDRAEEIVQEARGEGYDYRSIIHRIRALKHEPASKG